jgi:hypothetical protein
MMAAGRTVDIKVRSLLDAVVIGPGQKLIVRVSADTALDKVEEMRVQLTDWLPGVDVVMIPAEQLLVYSSAGPQECTVCSSTTMSKERCTCRSSCGNYCFSDSWGRLHWLRRAAAAGEPSAAELAKAWREPPL